MQLQQTTCDKLYRYLGTVYFWWVDRVPRYIPSVKLITIRTNSRMSMVTIMRRVKINTRELRALIHTRTHTVINQAWISRLILPPRRQLNRMHSISERRDRQLGAGSTFGFAKVLSRRGEPAYTVGYSKNTDKSYNLTDYSANSGWNSIKAGCLDPLISREPGATVIRACE